jgi:phospholipid/cholesterol/gamma-HCH transport system substrate-binding protein
MLRSRTMREGSVGLLIVTGILLFGAVALWLRGIKLGESTYDIIAEFSKVNGVQVGDGVRYRGLKVGRIKEIVPATNGVDVVIEIDSSELLIPRNVEITTSSSGLIGETFIDIRPPATPVNFNNPKLNPMGNNCDPQLILCDNEKLAGVPGITIDDLFPLMYELTSRLSENPELFDNVSLAAKNAAVAASEISQLSEDMSVLVTDVQSELGSFTDAAKAVSTVAGDASGQINETALKYQETATKLGQLVDNANQLVSQNRNNLTTTLDSISQTSDRLQGLIVTLDSTVAEADTKKLVNNLETLTANAADASANLKEISETFAEPNSVVALQQTLDSARVTFANAQKITADLEEVTGDPSFRTNVRNLVNGLSNLVSYTETLEQQIYTDRVFQDLHQFSTANSELLKQKKSIPNLQKQVKP